MGLRRQARILAVQALYAWDMGNVAVDELLAFGWVDTFPYRAQEGKRNELLSFARLLVSGTLEHRQEVDRQIRRQLEHWDFSRLAAVDRAILRMSTYALLFYRSIPPSVTIDEAVAIARLLGSDESYRFVNGILDGIRRRERAGKGANSRT